MSMRSCAIYDASGRHASFAPALRSKESGQIPPRRREAQKLLSALGIEGADEVRLQGTNQLLAKLGWAIRHEEQLLCIIVSAEG